jgi:hypothetical protein
MDDRITACCWQVLIHQGWRDFTLRHVHDHYPQYSLSELESLFPTPYHVVTAHSQSQVRNIPVPDGQDDQDLNEELFQSVISVIEFWWPYRDIMMYAILDMPVDLMMHCYGHVWAWMHKYWSVRPWFFGLLGGAPKAMLSFVLYVWIFPYALTHSLEEIWVRLDQWCTTMVNFIKKCPKVFDCYEFFDNVGKI